MQQSGKLGDSASVLSRRLIFCRTPLQSLIVKAIQHISPAEDVVVYQPTSASPKHRWYFDRIKAHKKVFTKYRQQYLSHYLSEWATYLTIPRAVRYAHYDSFLVASFNSLVFALLTRKHGGAKISTFDDGTMNLSVARIAVMRDQEVSHFAATKRLLGARDNSQLLKYIDRHYTIYPAERLATGSDIAVSVDLLDWQPAQRAPRGTLHILLGTRIESWTGQDPALTQRHYKAMVRSSRFDIFIPHPGEVSAIRVNPQVGDAADLKDMIEHRVSEDVLAALYVQGYDLHVYGVASSTLLNVGAFAKTYNVVLPGMSETDTLIFEAMEVKSIDSALII